MEAAARLARAASRPHFVFIGRGRHGAGVRERVERAGLGAQFTFAGFVDDLPAAMAALDVALYIPLESDGMSRVMFEYLAAGRALIAARVGVVPEMLLDGEHAVLVPGGDPAALAAAIERLWATRALRGSATPAAGWSRRGTRARAWRSARGALREPDAGVKVSSWRSI